MRCHFCNEPMEGDGYSVVLHCPDAPVNDYWFSTPDDEPVFCHQEPELCINEGRKEDDSDE